MSPRGRVAIIHVGGTIGMVQTHRGYEPETGFMQRTLEAMPELHHPEVPPFDTFRLEPLLDSADMTPRDWERIAEAIIDRYDDYAGFVILHGTDTMAYSASALSFLLAGLSKPVILTGAQISLAHVRSDGRDNLITSLILAGTAPIPEVCVCFGDRLFRGNRARKIRNADFAAFASPNHPPLAELGVHVEVAWSRIRPAGPGPTAATALARLPEVACVRVHPGLSPRLLQALLGPPTEAVVLETYGIGNFPSRDPDLLGAVERAVRRGVVVVNVSQCGRGRIAQEVYGSGRALAHAGVISGADMTPECALAKLVCLLGSGRSVDEVRALVATDLAGELTPAGEPA